MASNEIAKNVIGRKLPAQNPKLFSTTARETTYRPAKNTMQQPTGDGLPRKMGKSQGHSK